MAAQSCWDRELLSVPEASRRTKFSEKTIRGYIAEGLLPAFRFGRAIRIDAADLEAALVPVRPGDADVAA